MNRIFILILMLACFSCSSKMETIRVTHNGVPKPIGPYSHSTGYGNVIFVSGQIGIDQKTNMLKDGVEQQTVQIMENLKTILADNQSDIEHITKTTIFLTDMKYFEKVNEIYAKYFHGHFPARTTIEVASLPRNANIEIECIAVKR
ncbi:Rid family detoxifying hydrolase [Sphingobacterium thalpophilum]|uniref:Rid family detoxifying hydrolase n=1 Tax=Sphingobacterium thalpophilum TaxID=259 RepID=A0ABV4HC13_9SPHI